MIDSVIWDSCFQLLQIQRKYKYARITSVDAKKDFLHLSGI